MVDTNYTIQYATQHRSSSLNAQCPLPYTANPEMHMI